MKNRNFLTGIGIYGALVGTLLTGCNHQKTENKDASIIGTQQKTHTSHTQPHTQSLSSCASTTQSSYSPTTHTINVDSLEQVLANEREGRRQDSITRVKEFNDFRQYEQKELELARIYSHLQSNIKDPHLQGVLSYLHHNPVPHLPDAESYLHDFANERNWIDRLVEYALMQNLDAILDNNQVSLANYNFKDVPLQALIEPKGKNSFCLTLYVGEQQANRRNKSELKKTFGKDAYKLLQLIAEYDTKQLELQTTKPSNYDLYKRN